MKKNIERLLKHRTVSFTFAISFLLIIIGWIRAYFALRGIQQPLIIHFNNAFGINQIGGLADLSAAAVFGIVSLIIDFFLSMELDERDPFLGKLTAAAGLFFAALIFIGLSVIISVN